MSIWHYNIKKISVSNTIFFTMTEYFFLFLLYCKYNLHSFVWELPIHSGCNGSLHILHIWGVRPPHRLHLIRVWSHEVQCRFPLDRTLSCATNYGYFGQKAFFQCHISSKYRQLSFRRNSTSWYYFSYFHVVSRHWLLAHLGFKQTKVTTIIWILF